MEISKTGDWDRVVLGIDPGTNVMGYGVIGIKGKTPHMVTMGVLTLGKMGSHYMKLYRIYERVQGLVEQYLPDEFAIEAPFFASHTSASASVAKRAVTVSPAWSSSTAVNSRPSITFPSPQHFLISDR